MSRIADIFISIPEDIITDTFTGSSSLDGAFLCKKPFSDIEM